MITQKQGRYALYPINDTDRIPSHINITTSNSEIVLQHETLLKNRLHIKSTELIRQIREVCIDAYNKISLDPLKPYDDSLEYDLSSNQNIPEDESNEVWVQLTWEVEKAYWLFYIQKNLVKFLVFLEHQQLLEFSNLFDWKLKGHNLFKLNGRIQNGSKFKLC